MATNTNRNICHALRNRTSDIYFHKKNKKIVKIDNVSILCFLHRKLFYVSVTRFYHEFSIAVWRSIFKCKYVLFNVHALSMLTSK
jgi:hypothetical protein